MGPPPRQRAALVLADVLGFHAAEIARTLETTVPATNSALQRARETLKRHRPDESQQAVARALGSRGLGMVVDQFVAALEEGDAEAIVELLTDDASFEMPPHTSWRRGRNAISASWLIPERRPTGLKVIGARLNAQAAVAIYSLSPALSCLLPTALDVLELRSSRIARVVAFRSAESFERFDLPVRIAA